MSSDIVGHVQRRFLTTLEQSSPFLGTFGSSTVVESSSGTSNWFAISSQVKFSSWYCSEEVVVVQLSNHAHNVMTAEQMAVMNVETKALSAWSAKIGTMRSQSSCSSEILAAQRQCCPWCT